MANSPEQMNNGEDMSRLWYTGDSGESTEKTYEQWQEESMRRNAENLFPGDELAQEIAASNSLLEGESKEDFVKRIRRAAEAQRVAESGPSRLETGESQDAYNKRIAEATDAAMTRENIISDFDHNRPLWPQLSDDQKREVMHAYPRYDDETTPQWQARVEQELGVPVWMNSKAEAGNGANGGAEGAGASEGAGEGAGAAEGNGANGGAEGASEDQGAEGAGAGEDKGAEGASEGAGAAEDKGAEGAGEGAGAAEDKGAEGAAENKEAAKGTYRNDFENWEYWSDAERAAVLSLINTANAARKNAGEGGAGAGAGAAEGADAKKEGDGDKKDGEKSDEDKKIDNIIAMANGGDRSGDGQDGVDDDKEGDNGAAAEQQTGAVERKRNSKIGRKLVALGLTLAMLVGAGTLLTRSNRLPDTTPSGVEDDMGDDGDTGDTGDNDDGDGETGENQEALQFGDSYYFYNTDARGVEKNSDIAFCNAGEVLTTCLAEHPEWSDFETNNDSYNALMNAAQIKLSETGREYAAVTAWQICKQTNGAYFGDYFNSNMTADEAEAVIDGMTAEQSQAFFAEFLRAQSHSSWSADTLNGSGFTSGIRDGNLEGNTSDGFVYNVENCQEADLIILNRDFDGVNVQKQVFYDENGNVLGAIYMRVDLENATITTDPKGVVSIDDLSCCNIDVPDTPTPTPPETPPDTPTPTPTPPDTPTPTPTPDDSKKPVEVRDGDTQLNPGEGTDAPVDTAEFNNDTNNDGSDGAADYDQAPDSNTQVGAQNPNEQSADGSGNTVAQNVQNAETNGGSNGENTSNQENRAPSSSTEQTEAQQATQAQNNADTSTAAAKPANRQTEQRNAEAVASGDTSAIDKANEDAWKNNEFAIGN